VPSQSKVQTQRVIDLVHEVRGETADLRVDALHGYGPNLLACALESTASWHKRAGSDTWNG
jgi:hypothetical protein